MRWGWTVSPVSHAFRHCLNHPFVYHAGPLRVEAMGSSHNVGLACVRVGIAGLGVMGGVVSRVSVRANGATGALGHYHYIKASGEACEILDSFVSLRLVELTS